LYEQDGIPVANAVANVAFNKDDKVRFDTSQTNRMLIIPSGRCFWLLFCAYKYAYCTYHLLSFSHSSLANVPVSPSVPTVSLEDAIAAAEDALDGTFNEHPPTLEFLALEDGSLRLTHVMQIQNPETNAWFEAFVDAQTGEVLSVTDFVTKASVRITLFWLIWDSSYRLYSIWFFPSRRRS
jgi:extracellular elastinolytic metalloproteinase